MCESKDRPTTTTTTTTAILGAQQKKTTPSTTTSANSCCLFVFWTKDSKDLPISATLPGFTLCVRGRKKKSLVFFPFSLSTFQISESKGKEERELGRSSSSRERERERDQASHTHTQTHSQALFLDLGSVGERSITSGCGESRSLFRLLLLLLVVLLLMLLLLENTLQDLHNTRHTHTCVCHKRKEHMFNPFLFRTRTFLFFMTSSISNSEDNRQSKRKKGFKNLNTPLYLL